MRTMKGFMGSDYIPKRGSEESKAISKLKGMKVYEIMDDDQCRYRSFVDVWYAVAHEVDMWEEYVLVNGGSQADYNDYFGSNDGLNHISFKSATKWLEETKHLVKE